tara:strand:- start:19 stop:2592 length:2574 start_codon:yes stop_codon:yes gene_type:complete
MTITIQNISSDEIALKNEYNTRLKESKPANPEKDFENSVWTTLYSIGKFTTANINNSETQVTYKQKKRNVDVYLDNDEVTLYVEASTEEVGIGKIDKIVGKFHDYKAGAEAEAREQNKNVSFVFFTNRVKNFDETSSDLKKKGITLLSESYLDYLKNLIKNSPSNEFAYHQFLNFLFEGKRINKLDNFLKDTYFKDKPTTIPSKTHFKIPCTPGEDENGRFYLFKIQPYKLLPICNVPHRRHESLKTKTSFGFQRAIKNKKIDKIVKYLKGKNGGPFPNNIVIAYNHPSYPIKQPNKTPDGLRREKISNTSEKQLLTLCVEPNFGMWNVIDGQHRLFSYLDPSLDKEAKRHQIIVLAYENIQIEDQVEMFVDVNEKQTAVDKNLIWDLYPEILDSSDVKHKVSKLAKKLNESETPLKNTIKYPSAPKQSVPIKMNSLCKLFVKLKLFTAGSASINLILTKIKLDPDKIEDMAKYYSAYFNALKELIDASTKLDWDAKDVKNYVLHNMNVQAVVSLCESLSIYIVDKEANTHPKTIDDLQKHFKIYLIPLINYLNTINVEIMKKWRQGSKGESGWENLEKKYEDAIRATYPDFIGKHLGTQNLDNFNAFYQKLLDQQGESESLEIKESFLVTIKESNDEKLTDKEKEAKKNFIKHVINTWCAFANDLGGQMVVGIKDTNVKTGPAFEKIGIQSTDLKKRRIKKQNRYAVENYIEEIRDIVINQLGAENAKKLLKYKMKEDGLKIIQDGPKRFLYIKVNGQTAEEIENHDFNSLIFNDAGECYERVGSRTLKLKPSAFKKHFTGLKNRLRTKEYNYNEIKKCPKCNKTTASGFDQIEELFGFRQIGSNVRPQSWCRSCR